MQRVEEVALFGIGAEHHARLRPARDIAQGEADRGSAMARRRITSAIACASARSVRRNFRRAGVA